MRYSLRPYQSKAFKDMCLCFRAGHTSPVIVAPTGAGKTVIGCYVIEYFARRGLRALFLAHRNELITQCSGKLADIGEPHGVIKAGLDRGDALAPVQVASVQTYLSRQRCLSHDYGVIIIDEAHHAPASTYQKIIELNSTGGRRPLVIGLTATPYRADGQGLAGTFDSMVQVATTAELIEWGFLVPIRLFRAPASPDLAGLDMIGGDYDQAQVSKRVNKPKIVGNIVSEYLRLAYGRLALYFAVDVEHSKAICQAFLDVGITAEHIDGTTPKGERRDILDRHARGVTLVLVNCGVATEGYDCPPISAIGMTRPTKSRGLWRQMGGRGLRLSPETGKTNCLILDHAGVTAEHGYLTDPDTISLSGGLEEQEDGPCTTCAICGATPAGNPAYCPSCGAELRKPGNGVGWGDEQPAGLGEGVLSEDDRPDFFRPRAAVIDQPKELYKPARPQLTRLRRRRVV